MNFRRFDRNSGNVAVRRERDRRPCARDTDAGGGTFARPWRSGAGRWRSPASGTGSGNERGPPSCWAGNEGAKNYEMGAENKYVE